MGLRSVSLAGHCSAGRGNLPLVVDPESGPTFAQAVWNTSRVPRLAEPIYQVRLQSVTSMAFTLSAPLGALWGGAAVDRFGQQALLAGAALLAAISLMVLASRSD
jgi:predicted MFS family arabinose efflux permease